MNLKNLREKILKLRPLFFLIAILLVAYFVWVFISSFANPSFGVLNKPVFKSQLVSNPKWITDGLNIPGDSKASVFKVSKRGFSVSEAAALAKQLKFKAKPSLLQGSILNWTDPGQQLYTNLDTGEFNYKATDKRLFSSGTSAIDINLAAAKANEFLDLLGVDKSQIDLKKPNIEYYKTTPQSTEFYPGTAKDATLVKLIYPKVISGLNLVDTSGQQTIEVTLTTGNQLISIHFNRLEIEDSNASYPLEKESVLAAKISKDGANVVRYKDDSATPINNPDKVFVSQGNLRLFDDNKSQYIEPIFVFDGIVYKSFTNSQVEIYYPAIAGKYLK